MQFNVFKIARTMTYLFMGAWVVGVSIYTYSSPPRIKAYFEVSSPGAVPSALSDQTLYSNPCYPFGRSKEAGYTTSRGVQADLIICFRPQDFEGGAKLVPYLDENNQLKGGKPYSGEVSQYVAKAVRVVRLAESDEEAINAEMGPARQDQVIGALQWAGGGLVLLLALSTLIGWIARSVMGIPRGLDNKPGNQG